MRPHHKKQWVIHPKENAAFVAAMENVLEVYQRPFDIQYPVVNMDEQPVQLVKETRIPIPAKPGQIARVDYEYERNGTASIFLFTEPLRGWRQVSVRGRRMAIDWAQEIKTLLNKEYPDAAQVTLVSDNLNTHTLASLYKAFEPSEARCLWHRLRLEYTPKHGSWLNMAEIELSVRTRQCLSRRIPDFETLQQEVYAWQVERNAKSKRVDWRFTTEAARIRLKRLYPQYNE